MKTSNPFGALGIDPGAPCLSEIPYVGLLGVAKSLQKMYAMHRHPDKFPDALPAFKEKLNNQLAEVNTIIGQLENEDLFIRQSLEIDVAKARKPKRTQIDLLKKQLEETLRLLQEERQRVVNIQFAQFTPVLRGKYVFLISALCLPDCMMIVRDSLHAFISIGSTQKSQNDDEYTRNFYCIRVEDKKVTLADVKKSEFNGQEDFLHKDWVYQSRAKGHKPWYWRQVSAFQPLDWTLIGGVKADKEGEDGRVRVKNELTQALISNSPGKKDLDRLEQGYLRQEFQTWLSELDPFSGGTNWLIGAKNIDGVERFRPLGTVNQLKLLED